MFGRKKNNFYRYMFQKSFMPLFAMLVVISMAFLIFFRITVVREKQKDRENDQIRLEPWHRRAGCWGRRSEAAYTPSRRA